MARIPAALAPQASLPSHFHTKRESSLEDTQGVTVPVRLLKSRLRLFIPVPQGLTWKS